MSLPDPDADNWMNQKVNCLYCNIVAKDFSSLKCHLAGTDETVPACSKVPSGVKEMYKNELLGKEIKTTDEEIQFSKCPPKRKLCIDSAEPELTAGRHGSSRGKTVKTEFSENSGIESVPTSDLLSKESKKRIGRFVFENGIDFGAIKSPSFQQLVSLGSDQIPSCEELKGWIFEEAMEEMHAYTNEIRNSWGEAGCSILLDGWTDEKGRSLINILVDCPKGTIYLRSSDISDFMGNIDAMQLFVEGEILKEVGIENVVQVIAYSTSPFLKDLGKRIMDKHQSIFWTVSASCCIELVLQKLGESDLVKETMKKAKIITRFVYSYPELSRDLILVKPCKISSTLPFLTLENIELEEERLKTILLSSGSKYSNITKEGKRVGDVIRDRNFWSGVTTVVKGTIPLVRVMELMYEKDKAGIDYIYETIDQLKETIKEEFKHKKSQYSRFWDVIDDVWEEHLHSPLHSAGYFLNPNLFYTEDVHIDPEVCTGLLRCIIRSTRDPNVQDLMVIQLEEYRKAKGAFGVGCKLEMSSGLSPAQWWSKYGGECPELQRVAICILSQTCEGASKFKLNRSAAEALLTKGRNAIEEKRFRDMVFLQYNMLLQNFASGRANCDDIDPMSDWILDKSMKASLS